MNSGNDTDTSNHAQPGAQHEPALHASGLLAPGACVRDYVVEGFIASGGFGSVYRVHDPARDQPAALKILHPELRTRGDSFIRFLREAHVLERIRHTNIIDIHDSGTLSDGRAFLVMELLSGLDLGEHIKREGALSVDGALAILDPICDALAFAHERGVIHRDVKASNVFMNEQDGHRRIVLLDFGLAKIMEDGALELTSSRMTIGTPSSMAPEQIRGEAVDARTDVYGLGALTYHMLTGSLPFASTSQTVVQYMHLHGQRPRPSTLVNVGAAVDEVVLRAMAPDREARHVGPLEFLAELRESAQAGAVRPRRAKRAECRAVAIYVDVRVVARGPAGEIDSEGELLNEMDAILEIAEQHLLQSELHIGLEGSNSTLYVRALDPDQADNAHERREAVLAAVALHRVLSRRLGERSALHVNICLHCDQALTREGRIQGGELLRIERWAPDAELAGVVGSPEVFEGLSLDIEPAGRGQLVRLRAPAPRDAVDALSDEKSRERVMHAQMMAQLGRQVAGIVHDLRSPLNVVLGNIDLVLQRMESGEPLTEEDHRALTDAMTAAQQLEATTSNVLGASAVKSYGSDRRKLSVRQLVDGAVKLSHAETRRKAAMDITHEVDSHVMGSPGRLTQVLVNLIVNAAQAISDYGTIRIRTERGPGGLLHISICDTGVGMSSEVQARIFEPYFTTKDVNTGTGLGLALVREIVEEHLGTITVSSAPGAGACFTITLPEA